MRAKNELFMVFVNRTSLMLCTVAADVETGVTHHLRAWFERAVNADATKRCALVWRLYMFFEVRHNAS